VDGLQARIQVLLLHQPQLQRLPLFLHLAALQIERAQIPLQFLEADGLPREQIPQSVPMPFNLGHPRVVVGHVGTNLLHIHHVEAGVALDGLRVEHRGAHVLPHQFLQGESQQVGKGTASLGPALLEHLPPAPVVAPILAPALRVHAPQMRPAVAAVEHVPQQIGQPDLVLAAADPAVVGGHLAALLEDARGNDGRHFNGNPGLLGVELLRLAPHAAMLVGLSHVEGVGEDAAYRGVRPLLGLPQLVTRLPRRREAQGIEALRDSHAPDALLHVPLKHPPHNRGLGLVNEQQVAAILQGLLAVAEGHPSRHPASLPGRLPPASLHPLPNGVAFHLREDAE
jgi:hypothetical protein